jgi:hypothetical protein
MRMKNAENLNVMSWFRLSGIVLPVNVLVVAAVPVLLRACTLDGSEILMSRELVALWSLLSARSVAVVVIVVWKSSVSSVLTVVAQLTWSGWSPVFVGS